MPHKAETVDGAMETNRFKNISFEDYGRRALDPMLSNNEKVGFPDAFRDGHAEVIWQDMLQKLPRLAMPNTRILDIGCGCGHLPQKLIQHATTLGQQLVMIDHVNMLAQLRDVAEHRLIAGRFPNVLADAQHLAAESFDIIISYSVLHGVATEMNPFYFVDSAVELLAEGGQMLLGDVPNFSKLRRFLASNEGKSFHRSYMKIASDPHVPPFAMDKTRLDDGFMLGLLTHLRSSGFDAYILPQPRTLPLSSRREDILISKP